MQDSTNIWINELKNSILVLLLQQNDVLRESNREEIQRPSYLWHVHNVSRKHQRIHCLVSGRQLLFYERDTKTRIWKAVTG